MVVRGFPLMAVLLAVLAPATILGADRGGEETRSAGLPPSEVLAPRNQSARFEENLGQTDPRVRFVARARGYQAYFTESETVFVLPHGRDQAVEFAEPLRRPPRRTDVLRMRIEGAGAVAPVAASRHGLARSHFFSGSDPSKWVTGVRHYESIRTAEILPGFEMRWRARGDGALEYEFILQPGAEPDSLAIRFEGAMAVGVDDSGNLVISTPAGVLRHSQPRAWQALDGATEPVACRFELRQSGAVGIRLGEYDRSASLLIDPRVEFETYLGGTGNDMTTSCAVDSTGAVFVVGETGSQDFPIASALQGTIHGNTDVFLSKFSASGSALLFSTYIGGYSNEFPFAIAVDSAGSAYLTGYTDSTDYPTVGAIQPNTGGATDAFVTKINATGSGLVYATYLGANSTEYGYAIAVDASGAAYVTGTTASTGFPLVGPVQGTKGFAFDAYVAKIAPSGASLVYSTFLGGSGSADYGHAIAVDPLGAAYVAGRTNSTNFPLQGAFQTSSGGDYDAFVAKLAPSGASLSYSSYMGGTNLDAASGIVVDTTGVATIVGSTASSDLPLSNALDGSYGGGGSDGFVARVAADGASLVFSTYLGGTGADLALAVALDPLGAAYVTGHTASTDFPLQSSLQGTFGGGATDAFIAKFNAPGSGLVYSTYLGGAGADEGWGVALRGTDALLSGRTTSTDFPTNDPFQPARAGASDAFLAKMITTPIGASGLTAALIAVDGIRVEWADDSTDETGFEIQRKVGAGAFSTLTSAAADTILHDDSALARGTKYTYRVRAFNADGISPWSNEGTATTVPTTPGVPLSPSALEVERISPTRADLSWADESDDETFFEIQRKVGAGVWQVLGTRGANTTTLSDTGILPDRSYAYRVRAFNGVGASDYSEPAALSNPQSLEFVLERGLIKDSAVVSRDLISVRGTVATNLDSPDGAFDPMTDGIEVRLGGRDGPAILTLASGIEGWVIRRGRSIWRSPKGSPSRIKLVFDPASGALSFVIRRAHLPVVPTNPIVLSISVGDDAGTQSSNWVEPPRREGVLRYP